jgi:hypothetical protein
MSVKQWLQFMDYTNCHETARADEYSDTFLRPFDGDEAALYNTTYAIMPKSWGEEDVEDKRAAFYGDS